LRDEVATFIRRERIPFAPREVSLFSAPLLPLFSRRGDLSYSPNQHRASDRRFAPIVKPRDGVPIGNRMATLKQAPYGVILTEVAAQPGD